MEIKLNISVDVQICGKTSTHAVKLDITEEFSNIMDYFVDENCFIFPKKYNKGSFTGRLT